MVTAYMARLLVEYPNLRQVLLEIEDRALQRETKHVTNLVEVKFALRELGYTATQITNETIGISW